ncbi:putative transmembrane protein [Cavenderia fasciculata]|uniref:Transmembrane protein n=1 Tax=Cavenderia fasciculata TaxID=261658 RepID=F4Q729_CACFS|nr:putative transmembrane protein [Cavenderia fasciculata]EGG16211.1 putative transmembrane protein [Cavenderia fasciculata]|eukprot:XP_004354595.1 putative transmembrane protein [Cavenderia fasciculata]
MRSFVILSLLLLAIVCVQSHSVLKVPAAWNPNPSKVKSCGAGQPQGAAQATYCPSTAYTIKWQVVVGDGVGPVTIGINLGTKTTANFTTLKTDDSPTAVGTYSISVVMPATECNLCTLQIQSTSDWFSCSTISISASACGQAVTDAPLEPVKVDNQLSFCTMKNKKTVMVPVGANVADIDKATQVSFAANLANPLVFSNNDSNCRQLYYPFICDLAFPQAPGSFNETVDASNSLTQQECASFSSACQVTELHSSLYPCGTYPLEENSSNTLVASLASLVFVSVISTLLF